MIRGLGLIAHSLLLSNVVAQVEVGACTGWSHSRALAQGGPLVALTGELRAHGRSIRLSLSHQLPVTQYSAWTHDGSGRMIATGGWNDGHVRSIVTNRVMTMVAVGVDHLFVMDARDSDDRLDLRLGPGLAYMLEGIRTDVQVEDHTDGTSTFDRGQVEQESVGLRAILGGAYRLPLGTLTLESVTDVVSWTDGTHASSPIWLQRQAFCIGAVFPLTRK